MKYEYVLSSITAFIGAAVALLAYNQYRLAKDKFRLELFEKRFAVYKGVQVFLSRIMADAKVDLENFFEFRAATQDSAFLFESDIPDFIKAIDKEALDLHTLKSELEDIPRGEERSRLVKQESELIKQLTGRLPKLVDVFGSYLRFRAWK